MTATAPRRMQRIRRGVYRGLSPTVTQMSAVPRNILVTSALPNANGAIHLGHLLEHIQTDIWVRFQRLRGHRCIYVCADDTHGTATMLKADQESASRPSSSSRRIRAEHERDFQALSVAPRQLLLDALRRESTPGANPCMTRRTSAATSSRATSSSCSIRSASSFLADRFVKGECPRCGTADQYGDNCEQCGATYDATDLKNPAPSRFPAQRPCSKHSKHYFFDLAQFTDMLEGWTRRGTLQDRSREQAHGVARCRSQARGTSAATRRTSVSRSPDTTDKYFYVWMDAPIGYMASFENLLCTRERRRSSTTSGARMRPPRSTTSSARTS